MLQEREFEPIGSNEPQRVDCRVIAASAVDLERAVRGGTFREDLFFRINVIPVVLPPLRERIEDLPELVAAIVSKLERKLGLRAPEVAPEVLEAFREYRWPGNVRELENVLERMLVLHTDGRITAASIPLEILRGASVPSAPGEAGGEGSGFRSRVEAFEAGVIREALRKTGGRKKEAAEQLGITPRNLSYYLAKYGIE